MSKHRTVSSLITSGLLAAIPRELSTSDRLELVEEESTKYRDSESRKAGWQRMPVRSGMGEKILGMLALERERLHCRGATQ